MDSDVIVIEELDLSYFPEPDPQVCSLTDTASIAPSEKPSYSKRKPITWTNPETIMSPPTSPPLVAKDPSKRKPITWASPKKVADFPQRAEECLEHVEISTIRRTPQAQTSFQSRGSGQQLMSHYPSNRLSSSVSPSHHQTPSTSTPISDGDWYSRFKDAKTVSDKFQRDLTEKSSDYNKLKWAFVRLETSSNNEISRLNEENKVSSKISK